MAGYCKKCFIWYGADISKYCHICGAKLGPFNNDRDGTIKRVLEELHKDGVIECNQYQGVDFKELSDRVHRN